MTFGCGAAQWLRLKPPPAGTKPGDSPAKAHSEGRGPVDSGARCHELRHTFASRGLELGEGLPMIGKLLGHNQVQTTARYAHHARNMVRHPPLASRTASTGMSTSRGMVPATNESGPRASLKSRATSAVHMEPDLPLSSAATSLGRASLTASGTRAPSAPRADTRSSWGREWHGSSPRWSAARGGVATSLGRCGGFRARVCVLRPDALAGKQLQYTKKGDHRQLYGIAANILKSSLGS